MYNNKYVIRHMDLRPGCEYKEVECDLNNEGDTTGAFGGHGGGDLRLHIYACSIKQMSFGYRQ